MDPLAAAEDSSTDDDGASQTTEDDLEVPEHQEPPVRAASGVPTTVPPPPVSVSIARDRPHYELLHTISGHTQSISAVKFSPDGTLLASCGSSV